MRRSRYAVNLSALLFANLAWVQIFAADCRWESRSRLFRAAVAWINKMSRLATNTDYL
jgi:hypothetical protein